MTKLSNHQHPTPDTQHPTPMIDLAPHNPYSLSVASPVIIAPGCAAAGARRDLDPALIGALATRTAVRSTPPDRSARWAAVPAGVVYERLPTVSLRTLIKDEARHWARSSVPILLSLSGSPDELADMLAPLESIEGIAGVILQSDRSDLATAIDEARAQTPLPLLAMLPARDDLTMLARDAVAAGSDALIVCGYPQALAVDGSGAFAGALIGPTLAATTLHRIAVVAEQVDVPIIAHGGIADATIARHCLDLGASAVMIDAALYGDPDAPQRIATTLRSAANEAANS